MGEPGEQAAELMTREVDRNSDRVDWASDVELTPEAIMKIPIVFSHSSVGDPLCARPPSRVVRDTPSDPPAGRAAAALPSSPGGPRVPARPRLSAASRERCRPDSRPPEPAEAGPPDSSPPRHRRRPAASPPPGRPLHPGALGLSLLAAALGGRHAKLPRSRCRMRGASSSARSSPSYRQPPIGLPSGGRARVC